MARMMPWIVLLFLMGCNSSDDRSGVDDIQAMDRWGGCTQRLKDIHKPVLMITGTEDVLTPPQNSYFLVQHLPGSRLVTFEHGGHGAMNQFPAEFATAVINFLQ